MTTTHNDGAFVSGVFVRHLGTDARVIDVHASMGFRVNLFGTRAHYRHTPDAGIRAQIRALYHARADMFGTLHDISDVVRDIAAELPDETIAAIVEPDEWGLEHAGVSMARQRGMLCAELANARARWLTTRRRPAFVIGIDGRYIAYPVLTAERYFFFHLALELPAYTPAPSDYEDTIRHEIARVWRYA